MRQGKKLFSYNLDTKIQKEFANSIPPQTMSYHLEIMIKQFLKEKTESLNSQSHIEKSTRTNKEINNIV